MGDVPYDSLNTVDTSYANLLNTPDNHVYWIDICSSNNDGNNEGYDLSGYVFEFFTLDTSTQLIVNPSFDTIIQQVSGLEDCSAVATLDVSLSKFQHLFSFKSDSNDINDLSTSDLEFTINNLSCFDDICFSKAIVQAGNINFHNGFDQSIGSDYVRNLAKQITGGLSASDIFSNEVELISGVEDMDISLDSSLNEKIAEASTGTYLTTDTFDGSTYKDLYKAAHALLIINLNSNNSSEYYQRTIDLFTDICNTAYELQTTNEDQPSLQEIEVSLNFHHNDKIAVRVEYQQSDTTGGLDQTNFGITIEPRSYKVILNLVDESI